MVIANLFMICFLILYVIFLHRTALILVVRKWAEWVDDRVHVHQHFRVPEFTDSAQRPNRFYRRVSLYLNSLPSLKDSDFTSLFSGRNANDIVLAIDEDRPIQDVFLGARVSWVDKTRRDGEERVVSRSFVLRIKKKDRQRILKPYLQHIHTVSDDIEQRGRQLRIYSNGGGRNWTSVPFDCPSDFETLVMKPDLKAKIRNDLQTFLKSKQYYHKLGRVWRRSYLLYGSSGTGKSSFIAAAANLLCYDIYNFNLSQVVDESDLNALLLGTTSKSLIVVEDFDRYVSGKSTTARMTLTGLLNFMDGLLNFQEERIMIFTMNDKDGVDPALLRPGRMDMHIHFPMCDFNSFRNLASNYLGVKEHKLFPQVEEIFQTGATMSPAEISELMLVNRSSPSRALKSVISALQSNCRNAVGAPRQSDGATTPPAPPLSSENVASGSGAWKDALMAKEIRKLYGMLRMKSCKTPGSFDRDSDIIQR